MSHVLFDIKIDIINRASYRGMGLKSNNNQTRSTYFLTLISSNLINGADYQGTRRDSHAER